jgi:hypothetical protein
MAQEFQINSSSIESKINQLLPSQGGYGAGIDFSASTMVIPVVDLTTTAEGSSLRQDLQESLSFDVTSNEIANATTTVISTTGFFKCFAQSGAINAGGSGTQEIRITDGSTSKVLFDFQVNPTGGVGQEFVEFVVCVGSGQSIVCQSGATTQPIRFVSRQIATIQGNLVNPTALQT